MSDKLWKATERKIAKLTNGKRNPVHGSGPKCDVSTSAWSIQVKETQRLPDWLKEAMAEAQRECESSKLALTIFHEKGKQHDSDVVCISLSDFLEWYG